MDNLLQSRLGAVKLAVAVGVAYFLMARLGVALTPYAGLGFSWPAAGIAAGALIVLGPAARLPVAIGVAFGSIASSLMLGRSAWLSPSPSASSMLASLLSLLG